MKTVLITGANKGIGFETARQLAASGYYVFLGSRDKIKGTEAIKKLNDSGIANAAFVELDVTDIDSIQKAKQTLESKIASLDILINNAGIPGELPQNISSVKIENLRKVFDTNFFGAVQTTQQFIPLLMKSNEPRIINVSSGLGSLTAQSHTQNLHFKTYDAYSCSKTALNAFTVLLANELRDADLSAGRQGFKINSITPGYTATDLNNFQGPQTVEQAAQIIVKYVTLENAPTGKFLSEAGEIDW